MVLEYGYSAGIALEAIEAEARYSLKPIVEDGNTTDGFTVDAAAAHVPTRFGLARFLRQRVAAAVPLRLFRG